MFNKEKREKAKATKEILREQIKPRPTFKQRQEGKKKRAEVVAEQDELNKAVAERLKTVHSEATLGDEVVQLGAQLHYLGSFSALQITVQDHINGPEGKVVTRWTVHGKHDGDFLGIPPTGKDVSIGGTSLCFVQKGEVTQESHYWDVIGLLQQIQK